MRRGSVRRRPAYGIGLSVRPANGRIVAQRKNEYRGMDVSLLNKEAVNNL